MVAEGYLLNHHIALTYVHLSCNEFCYNICLKSNKLRHLLEGGAYSHVSFNGEVLITGRRLFEAQHLLEEIRQSRYFTTSYNHG